jgi:hypothetical protein
MQGWVDYEGKIHTQNAANRVDLEQIVKDSRTQS